MLVVARGGCTRKVRSLYNGKLHGFVVKDILCSQYIGDDALAQGFFTRL
jgi:hypothetical protein